MITEEIISATTADLAQVLHALGILDSKIIRLKFDISQSEANAIDQGEVTGGNDTTRKAQLALMFLPERNKLADYEADKAKELRIADVLRSELKSYHMILMLQGLRQPKEE